MGKSRIPATSDAVFLTTRVVGGTDVIVAASLPPSFPRPPGTLLSTARRPRRLFRAMQSAPRLFLAHEEGRTDGRTERRWFARSYDPSARPRKRSQDNEERARSSAAPHVLLLFLAVAVEVPVVLRPLARRRHSSLDQAAVASGTLLCCWWTRRLLISGGEHSRRETRNQLMMVA